MKPDAHNHIAWWVGGFVAVAIIIGSSYYLSRQYFGKLASSGTSATIPMPTVSTPTPTPSDGSQTSTILGIGGTVPPTPSTTADLSAMQQSLDATDTSALSSGLSDNSAELSSF